jgi:hypothetical protein
MAHGRPGYRALARPRVLAQLLVAFGLLLAPALAKADEASATPPRPRVALSLADASPVIGVTGETALRIEVVDPPETPMPLPRVLCSAGQIEDLGREGPATFTARFILPASRLPQPAIVVAEFGPSPAPLRGMLPVPLAAATTKSLHTDPGAQVTLRVGDHDFGPHPAPADGWVHVPIVVPPGVGLASARSVNRYGKATELTVDLRVPYSQRLLLVPPETLAAGSVAEVAVYAVETSGQPADGRAIVMRAPGARVQPLGSHAPGEARFLISAPPILKTRSLRVEAQLRGQSTTRVATRVTLVPGKAASLTLEPEAPYLTTDGKTSVRVFLGAEDAYGNPVDASRAEVLVDGQVAEIKTGDTHEPAVVVSAPKGAKQVVIESVLDDGHALRRIPIGSPRRSLPARPLANRSPHFTLTPRLGVLWNLGAEVGAALFVDAAVYRSTRYPNLGMGLSLGIVASTFAAESGNGITRASLTTVPLLFELRRRTSAKPWFVAFGAGAGFAWCYGRIHSYGTTVTAHGYGAAVQAAVETGFILGEAHLVFSLRYLAVYLAELSSGDRIAGNAAGALADLGYRLIW